MTKRTTREKRTKSELIDEIEALESKYRNAPTPDPTSAALAKESAIKARTTARGLSVDSIVAAGGAFGLEVQRTLANVTEQIVAKMEELKTVTEACVIESAELERLYEIDVASAAVGSLLHHHAEERARLEREIDGFRTSWKEEHANYSKQVSQQKAETEAARKKEAAEYDYNTKQTRARVEEEWQHRMNVAQRNEAERVEQVNKDLAARNAAVNEARTALEIEKTRVAKLVEDAEKATAAQVAIATNSLKKELTAQFTLEKKDAENALNLERQRVASQQAALEGAWAENAALRKQLDAAKQQVTDITIKALESASGAQALASVQALVKDGATNGRVSKT